MYRIFTHFRGRKKIRKFTAAHIGHKLAIVLNNLILSAPIIQDTISCDMIKTGQFTAEEAQVLAMVLNSGGLSAPVNIVQEKTIDENDL